MSEDNKRNTNAEETDTVSSDLAPKKPRMVETEGTLNDSAAKESDGFSALKKELEAELNQKPASNVHQSEVSTGKPQQPVHKVHHKHDPKARRNRKIHAIEILVLIAALGISAVLIVINTLNVSKVSSNATAGEKETLALDTGKKLKNDFYTISNNPTDYQKELFQQLTDALSAKDDQKIAEAVAENFAADYFTWSNKDGNYEVGGLQFYVPGKFVTLEDYSRYNYYSNLDLFITQYGRENLPAVENITMPVATKHADQFTIYTKETPTAYDCYEVTLAWDYTMGDTVRKDHEDYFFNSMIFQVINVDGTWYVAEFYDKASHDAWEKEHANDAAPSATPETDDETSTEKKDN